jgi:signal transduction histidine kinase
MAEESMDVQSEVTHLAPRRIPGWSTLLREVARVPLPIRAKQLIGSLVVAALLALVAVLGLLALGQSNSRGTELRRLQKKGAYEQLLLTDATQLKLLLDVRLGRLYDLNDNLTKSDEPDLRAFDPASYKRGFLSSLDQQIGNEFNQLCADVGAWRCLGPPPAPQQLSLTLRAIAPSLVRPFEGPVTNPPSAADTLSLFYLVSGASGLNQSPLQRYFVRADRWAASYARKLAHLTAQTKARANALVATDRRSYAHSRALLIGAGAGSLLLALTLGLLLSDSFLVPLRKTQKRLATIAAGDFVGHVDVPNRDEIGALAADVNRMSEKLRRLYRELEAASRHKSDFLATMSHELRTPLNAIIGFSEVLKEEMFGTLNQRQLAYVQDVLDAGKHLLSLINDVLDLAKIEAGRMELNLSPVSIPEILRSAMSMNADRASRSRLELALAAEQTELVVYADERRIRQVIFNLLSNAIKFTPAGGRIEISAHAHDGQVEIAVADTGPGIVPADLEMIFEEFQQTSEGKEAEGTGLGLPLSRRLVELHGGRLWAESEVGGGSTFRFTLPVEEKAVGLGDARAPALERV